MVGEQHEETVAQQDVTPTKRLLQKAVTNPETNKIHLTSRYARRREVLEGLASYRTLVGGSGRDIVHQHKRPRYAITIKKPPGQPADAGSITLLQQGTLAGRWQQTLLQQGTRNTRFCNLPSA